MKDLILDLIGACVMVAGFFLLYYALVPSY